MSRCPGRAGGVGYREGHVIMEMNYLANFRQGQVALLASL
jgi:hypothetical protein